MSFNAFDIAGSGMTAQRVKMDTIASNIANINTTRNPDGSKGVYIKKDVAFKAVLADKISRGPSNFSSNRVDAEFNSNTGSLEINGSTYEASTLSDNGEYTCVMIDTSSEKDIELSTSSSAKRGMVNAIEYVIGSSSSGEGDEDPIVPVTPTLTGVTIQGDMTQKTYNEGDEWNLAFWRIF